VRGATALLQCTSLLGGRPALSGAGWCSKIPTLVELQFNCNYERLLIILNFGFVNAVNKLLVSLEISL
jgi:hypothetical protein